MNLTVKGSDEAMNKINWEPPFPMPKQDGQGAGRANEQVWQRRRATMGCAFPGCFQWARGLSNYCPQHRPFHVETEEQEHARLMRRLEVIERALHRWIPTLCLCIIIAAVVGLALRKGGFL